MAIVSRRSVVIGAPALLLASRAASAADPAVVRFGVLHPNLTTLIHEIAKKTGAYERNNLSIVETKFKSGQTVEGVEQLWRGRLDFYMGGAPEVPRLNSRILESGGQPPLAVVSGANPGHTSLVLSNKLNPKSIDELFNQPLKMAVSSLSSVHLAFFRGYLQTERKMDPNSLPWKFLGIEAGSMLPALLTGQIDGFLHSEPTTTLALVNKAGHLFMRAATGDFGKDPPPSTFLSSRRDYLAQNGDTARRFLKALFEANDAFANMPADKMVPIIQDWSGQDETTLRAAYERLNPECRMTKAQAQKWWDMIASTMVERGELGANVRPFDHVFDLSFQPIA